VVVDDGTVVVVTLTDSNGASSIVSSESCSTGTVNGMCAVTFSSSSAGTTKGHASATILSGGLSLVRETDGLAGNSGDATKIWIAGSLSWLKHDNNGNLLGGATFEVCRTFDRFGTAVTGECVTVLDNNSPDADPASGQFLLTNLLLGTYTIQETVPPSGFSGDLFVETLVLTLAAPDQSATHIWINTPAQGCTPGWWKNQGLGAYDQSTDALAVAVTTAVADYWYGGVAPAGFDGTHTALFRDAFNVTSAQMTAAGLDPNLTLLGAIELGGGNYFALARQGTAALLNSVSVAYPYDASQVLQLMHDAS
jgi:hypothetical protein